MEETFMLSYQKIGGASLLHGTHIIVRNMKVKKNDTISCIARRLIAFSSFDDTYKAQVMRRFKVKWVPEYKNQLWPCSTD